MQPLRSDHTDGGSAKGWVLNGAGDWQLQSYRTEISTQVILKLFESTASIKL